MVLNKRGMFFTLLAIVIISIFIMSFVFISGYEQRRAVNKRVETLNNFVLAVEDDLSRELYASGYRIIFVFEKKILESDVPITDDFNGKVSELFFDGTYDGVPEGDMGGATLDYIKASLDNIASKVNAEVTFSNSDISMSQDDSWNVKITLTTDLLIEDVSGMASWDVPGEIIEVDIPISNFDDPLYVLSTNGKLLNKMVQNENLILGDTSSLSNHAVNSLYYANDDAPSFLSRLQGEFSNGDAGTGIESFVNLQELSQAGINARSGVSVVDHLYFTDSTPGSDVGGMPDWFRIDNTHESIYWPA